MPPHPRRLAGLPDLPQALLAHIASLLDEPADRARLEQCCRAAAAAAARSASGAWWGRLAVSLASEGQAGRFAGWLAARRPDLRELEVEIDDTAWPVGFGLTLPTPPLPRLAAFKTYGMRLSPAQLAALLAHTSLERLDLTLCDLQSLPSGIAALSALRSLVVADNLGLSDGWQHLAGLTALTELDVNSSGGEDALQRHWALLSGMPALQSLWVGVHSLEEAEPPALEPDRVCQLAQLTGLTYLALTQCGLRRPVELSALSQLSCLAVYHDGLCCWGDLASLARLTSLTLHDCELAAVPPQLSMLPALEVLDIDDNPIRSWEALSHLVHLTELYISACGIAVLPSQIAALTTLCKLDLSFNHLLGHQRSDWGRALAPLRHLSSLSLAHCGIVEVPRRASTLTALQELYLEGCNLAWSAEAAGSLGHLSGLSRLTMLTMGDAGTYASTAPPALSLLSSLCHLKLCYSSVKRFRTAVGVGWQHVAALTRLTCLDLSCCRGLLPDLPPAIAQLSSLQVLNLDRTGVSSGWEHLLALPRLMYLSLKDGHLSEPPPELSPITAVARIRLRPCLNPY